MADKKENNLTSLAASSTVATPLAGNAKTSTDNLVTGLHIIKPNNEKKNGDSMENSTDNEVGGE